MSYAKKPTELIIDPDLDDLALHKLWKFLPDFNRKPIKWTGICLVLWLAGFLVAYFWRPTVFEFTASLLDELLGFILFMTAMFLLIDIWIFPGFLRTLQRRVRVKAFAAANGFEFESEIVKRKYLGVIFNRGEEGSSTHNIKGIYRNLEFEVFNYSYRPDSGLPERRYGVIMVELLRELPHIIFDSRANNIAGLSNLGLNLQSRQEFQFEGDFNKYFRVFVPENYQRDVLYFMTPELMQLMVSKAGLLDMEVVGAKLFFYGGEFSFKKAQLEEIFELIAGVGGEFTENMRLYKDERVENRHSTFVSKRARRLKSKLATPIQIATLAILIAFLLKILFEIYGQ
ncbi:MAG TPA: hypothetical protein VM124_03055 [Candidatus Limnocylindrales bacterium]|nr:hypothetical protein [Candidatus Limnocylindrales bacterium]